EEEALYSGIFPDYTVPGLNPYISALITGLIGCFIIILASFIISKIKNAH
ncbi:metal transporter, partial [Thermoplasmatales archaeon ex4484_30]